jgi:predicted transcriptional regulator
MNSSITPSLLEIVARREYVIEHLLQNHADKRELETALDVSRTTVNRAVNSLSDAECITYHDGKWSITLLGQVAYEEYKQLVARYEGLTTAQSLLHHLSPGTPLDGRLLTDMNILLAEPPAPHAPITQLEDLLQHSNQIKGLSSVVLPRYVPLFHHHIVERETDTELVLDVELIQYLCKSYPDEMYAVFESDTGMVWQHDQKPPFGLVLIDEEVVWFAVYDEDGGLKGAIINDSEAAIIWATEIFHSYRQQAEPALSRSGLTHSCDSN